MKFNSEFRTTFWFPALSCLLSKEAIWKWQVARWRRGSDDDKYLMRSSLNNSSRLEWIIEIMAMNHGEGPDLISLYRNSQDYSCTPLLKKKLLTCFIVFRQRKSCLTICTTRSHRSYGKILPRKSFVLNSITLNSISRQWLRRPCTIFLWILKMRPCHWMTFLLANVTYIRVLLFWNMGYVTCVLHKDQMRLYLTNILCGLRLLWKLRKSFFTWLNPSLKQLRKIL